MKIVVMKGSGFLGFCLRRMFGIRRQPNQG